MRGITQMLKFLFTETIFSPLLLLPKHLDYLLLYDVRRMKFLPDPVPRYKGKSLFLTEK